MKIRYTLDIYSWYIRPHTVVCKILLFCTLDHIPKDVLYLHNLTSSYLAVSSLQYQIFLEA